MLVESLTFALLVTATYSLPSRDVSDDPVVCETEACKSAADSILTHIDESVDPCEDWYLYACGGFEEAHPRPYLYKYYQGGFDALSLLNVANSHRVIAALEDARFLTHGSKVVRKVKHLYDECMKKSDDHDTFETISEISRQLLLKRLKILNQRETVETFTPIEITPIHAIFYMPMDRNDSCRLIVENKYYYAVTRMYLDMFMDRNATADARRMIENIYDAWINSVQVSVDDEFWKAEYRERMQKIERQLVYPDWIVDDAKLGAKYDVNLVEFDDLMAKREPWDLEILEANAMFIFRFDEDPKKIVIPAGILQGLLYNKDSAPALNYGGGGFVAAQGMSNKLVDPTYLPGFGAERCILDQMSTVVGPHTKSAFLRRLTKADFTSKGKTELEYLLEEMRAYIGAINATIIAMKDNVKQDIRLPGAAQKFTPMQLFFLSAANTLCSERETPHWSRIWTLRYSLNYHRAVIPLMNSPDFAEAFSCKPGTPMNPVEKCRLW